MSRIPSSSVLTGGDQATSVISSAAPTLGENRIYAVNQGGQLLSYSDNGTPGNVGHPVVVGADGWDQFSTVFWCGNIFAVGQNGDLLSYMDGGGPGNVGNPSIAGKSMWKTSQSSSAASTCLAHLTSMVKTTATPLPTRFSLPTLSMTWA